MISYDSAGIPKRLYALFYPCAHSVDASFTRCRLNRRKLNTYRETRPPSWENGTWQVPSQLSHSDICVSELDQHWIRKWLVAYSPPMIIWKQYRVIFNKALKNKLPWNLNQNKTFSFRKMYLEISSAKWWQFCPEGDELIRCNWILWQYGASFYSSVISNNIIHDDVIEWKHFPRYWPFVRGIHRPPVNSSHKGQWRRALMFSLICAWITDWVNNRKAGDLRRYRAHFDVTVMPLWFDMAVNMVFWSFYVINWFGRNLSIWQAQIKYINETFRSLICVILRRKNI